MRLNLTVFGFKIVNPSNIAYS